MRPYESNMWMTYIYEYYLAHTCAISEGEKTENKNFLFYK